MKTPIILLFWLSLTATICLGFNQGNFSRPIVCSNTERDALLKFKHNLTDPSGRLASWGDDGDCCRWAGVLCDNQTGHIIELHLSGTKISYQEYYSYAFKINPSLLKLKHLMYLNLSNSDFGGIGIPEFLGSMRSLKYLDLSGARFGGMIPYQLGNLSSLYYLNLQGNEYSYVENLQWLAGLPKLEFLDLSNVNLDSAFDWLEMLNSLPSLIELHLSHCQLPSVHRLPIVNFSSLSILDLSSNQIFEKSSISKPKLPCWISHVKTLVSLYLANTKHFQGSIPNDLQNLTLLRELDLSYNLLNSSIPNWLYGFSNLEHLTLRSNILQGEISSAFGNMTSLISLDLSSSFELDLSREGIPISFKNLSNLKKLSFSRVSLNQDIAEVLEFVPDNLEYLSLNSCQLLGQLTNKLGQLKNLSYLDLSFNNLEGTIPFVYTSVNALDLSGNSLSGSLSNFLCHETEKMKNMQRLYLGRNLLSGEIPNCWKSWKYLVSIDLSNNRFSGKIPNSIGTLRLLESLHLWNNSISGELPKSQRHCTKLVTLDFSENELEGNIPAWIGDGFSNLRSLSLRANKFHDHIPEELCNLPSLQYLDLALNNLSGEIPNCVNNFSAMSKRGEWTGEVFWFKGDVRFRRSIDLSSNSLSGEIPQEITDLVGLNSLDLSHNKLTGRIPRDIDAMRSLRSIDFSFNQISGNIPPAMSNLQSLSRLNLSFNKLWGRISGTYSFAGFDASSFIGNDLCGPQLLKQCDEDDNGLEEGSGEDDNGLEEGREEDGYGVQYIWILSATPGFIVGFWGAVGSLILNSQWRYAYFGFLDRLGNKIWWVSYKFCRFLS